jgi:hypothetical protein
MNGQHDYLVVKAHIDDLLRSAERPRMAGGVRPRTPPGTGRGLIGRLRRRGGRPRALTASDACVECP